MSERCETGQGAFKMPSKKTCQKYIKTMECQNIRKIISIIQIILVVVLLNQINRTRCMIYEEMSKNTRKCQRDVRKMKKMSRNYKIDVRNVEEMS